MIVFFSDMVPSSLLLNLVIELTRHQSSASNDCIPQADTVFWDAFTVRNQSLSVKFYLPSPPKLPSF